MIFKVSWILFISQCFFQTSAWAAACCGGSSASPSLILGDDRLQLSTQLSRGQTVVDYVDAMNGWHTQEDMASSETLKIDVVYLVSDLWQVGASIPWIQKKKAGEHSAGLGDVSLTLGYEYLPDWSYHPWRPKGVGYLQLLAPFGKSNEEASDIYKLETRGRGYWQLGLGTILTKTKGIFDGFCSLDTHYSFAKQIHTEVFEGRASPGWGGQMGVGLGYNFKNWRVGSALSWIYEEAVHLEQGQIVEETLPQRLATASVSLAYLFSEQNSEIWSSILTYADQTLFGDPLNTSLDQVVSVLIQHRWTR